MAANPYEELCTRLMVPDSGRLARIWEMIVDNTDAALLLAMPATASDLAEKTGLASGDVDGRVGEMFKRGVVFESEKPTGTIYRPPKHLVQFHDASTQWPEAPESFFDLWREFMHEEYGGLVRQMAEAGFPSFMRAVPALASLESLPGLEPMDDLRAMIEGAEEIAVVNCPCRLVERNCDSDKEVCLQMDKGARYVLKRGTGRALTRQEALDLLTRCEDAGLVHFVNNRKGIGTFICNCCNCCCAIIKPTLEDPACRPILAPSRFLVEVAEEQCTGDALCEDVCPVSAIRVEDDSEVTAVDAELCIGCGLCLAACQFDALRLKEVRPAAFIPD